MARMQSAALTLEDVWRWAAEEAMAAAGAAAPVDAPTAKARLERIWEPLPVMPGRGIRQADGSVLSPQQAAYESCADELLYGGAPGGGKSYLLLGLAAEAHLFGAIFRRQFAQFSGPGGLIAKSRDLIGLRGRLSRNVWHNIDDRRSFEFLGCDHEKDLMKYRGRDHDFKGFDELPEFPERYYRTLIAWARTATPGQRVRVVSTANPPEKEEGRWVLHYWGPWLDPNHPNPAKDGELRWFVTGADGRDVEVPGPTHGSDRAPLFQVVGLLDPKTGKDKWVEPRSRSFIKAEVEDNPLYMATGYDKVLDAMPEPMRSRMRYGDFKAAVEDHPNQLIPSAWIDAAQRRWVERETEDHGPLSCVGCDVSRGGSDEFVLAPRYADYVDTLLTYPAAAAPDGQTGALLVRDAVGGDPRIPINIDVGGPGVAVFDYVGYLKLRAVAMNGARKTKTRTRQVTGVEDTRGTFGFANDRARFHWRFREALDPVFGATLALPPDPQMRADLCAIRFTVELAGIRIELKDRIKERIGRSPDRGEAVIYACVPDESGGFALLFGGADIEDARAQLAALKAEMGIGDHT